MANTLPMISVITPTANRASWLRKMYHCFVSQNYANKELLVLDDSAQVDIEFQTLTKDDARVRYVHSKKPVTIGRKRNRLIEMAKGEVIAHFDDDDYYAPNYLSEMYDAMRKSDAAIVKLGCWYNYSLQQNKLAYVDTTLSTGQGWILHPHRAEIEAGTFINDVSGTWGYGFSYLYQRKIALELPFKDINHGEDYDFVARCFSKNLRGELVMKNNLALHNIHSSNTSLIYCQRIEEGSRLSDIFGAGYLQYVNADQTKKIIIAKTEVKVAAGSTAVAEVALCMIVKNEEAVISRALQSAKPLIDYWLICDTGSTDRSKEIIRETMTGIPGELHDRPWVNFCHNRNEALTLLQGKAKYALILDADDMYVTPSNYKREVLDHDGYHIQIQDGNVRYSRLQLIRVDLDYRYHGEIHEVIGCPTPKKEKVMENVIYKRLSGGARSRSSNKFLDDAKILTDLCVKEPTVTRHVFYLAQSWRDAGETAKAIQTYRQLVNMYPPRNVGIWAPEELYYSMLQIAQLLEKTDASEAEIIDAYLQAYEALPTRAEPLSSLSYYLRRKKRYRGSAPFAKLAAEMPAPNTNFFLQYDVYEWRAKDDYATALTWLRLDEEAIDVYDALLRSGKLPTSENDRVLSVINDCYRKIAARAASNNDKLK